MHYVRTSPCDPWNQCGAWADSVQLCLESTVRIRYIQIKLSKARLTGSRLQLFHCTATRGKVCRVGACGPGRGILRTGPWVSLEHK